MNDINTPTVLQALNPNPQVDLNYDEVCKFIDPKKLGTPQEYKHFFELCKARKMNPLLKEVYWIKYSSNSAAQNVIGVDTFVSRATEDPNYEGYESGWYIQKDPEDAASVEPTTMPFGKIVGAWCQVFKTDKKPILYRVRFDAYSTGKSRWVSDPFGMIEKCAIAGAHRKAYPKAFAQFYTQEEYESGNIKDITPEKGETNEGQESKSELAGSRQSTSRSSIEKDKKNAPRPNSRRSRNEGSQMLGSKTDSTEQQSTEPSSDTKSNGKDKGQGTKVSGTQRSI